MGVTLFTRSEVRKSCDLGYQGRVTSSHFRIRGARELYFPNARTICRKEMSGQSKPSWASNLHPVGLHYYAGLVDNAQELLEEHKMATQSSFGTRTSTKKASIQRSTSPCKENDDPNEIGTSKVRLTLTINHEINVYTYITMCALISYVFRQR